MITATSHWPLLSDICYPKPQWFQSLLSLNDQARNQSGIPKITEIGDYDVAVTETLFPCTTLRISVVWTAVTPDLIKN